jgi:hypothetical protein
MAIEKPAAIFSEAGLKIFVEALLGVRNGADLNELVGGITNINSGSNGHDGHNAEVEALVTEYKEFKKADKSKERRMDEITEVISEFLADGKIKNNEQIYSYVKNCGFSYKPNSIGPVMRGVCKRNQAIEKISKSEYRLKGFDL